MISISLGWTLLYIENLQTVKLFKFYLADADSRPGGHLPRVKRKTERETENVSHGNLICC